MTKKVKIPNHIHKFFRKNLSRNPGVKPYLVYACQQPACTYYIPLTLALNKLAECWRCGDPFVMDKYSITLLKPHCNSCIKKPTNVNIEDLSKLAENI